MLPRSRIWKWWLCDVAQRMESVQYQHAFEVNFHWVLLADTASHSYRPWHASIWRSIYLFPCYYEATRFHTICSLSLCFEKVKTFFLKINVCSRNFKRLRNDMVMEIIRYYIYMYLNRWRCDSGGPFKFEFSWDASFNCNPQKWQFHSFTYTFNL